MGMDRRSRGETESGRSRTSSKGRMGRLVVMVGIRGRDVEDVVSVGAIVVVGVYIWRGLCGTLV